MYIQHRLLFVRGNEILFFGGVLFWWITACFLGRFIFTTRWLTIQRQVCRWGAWRNKEAHFFHLGPKIFIWCQSRLNTAGYYYSLNGPYWKHFGPKWKFSVPNENFRSQMKIKGCLRCAWPQLLTNRHVHHGANEGTKFRTQHTIHPTHTYRHIHPQPNTH